MRRLTLSSTILGLMTAAALPAASAASGDFRGAVEVDGRKIHLECKGEGRPAVILVSAYRNDAEIWTVEPPGGRTPVFARGGSRGSLACVPTTARGRSSTPTT